MSLTKNSITLKGSADIISEFFDCGINSIIYLRGIYPDEFFTREEKYGLPFTMTRNEQLKAFIENVLKQLHKRLLARDVHRLVLVISSVETKETLERWEFKIQFEGEIDKNGDTKANDIKEIRKDIRNIIRQITATVTFLPLLDTACAFDILLYTSKDLDVPEEWAEEPAHLIPNCEEVCLSSFSTTVHNVNTAVQYKSCD